jgi:ppGpp synthetase/RelA/SpoT-type nucleotidyltranferase
MTSDPASRYEAERPHYERLATKIRGLLAELLANEGIRAECDSRAKTVESFREKIARPGKEYSDPLTDVTDLAGIRVVLHSLADVERVGRIIATEFEVDRTRSVNKAEQLDPDRFGYLSQHYIVKLTAARAGLSDWKGLKDRWAEIQIRTTLQHAWAVIQHSLDYKNSIDVPQQLRRRLFRVSALLELADEELDALGAEIARIGAEYRDKLAKGNPQIELNVDSLREYVLKSPEVAYWNDFLRTNTGQRVESWGDLSRDVRIARDLGWSSVESIDRLLKEAHGWGEQFFTQYYQEFFRRTGATPDRVMTVVHGVITLLMLASGADTLTPERLERDYGFGSTYILDAARNARPSRTRGDV